MEKTENKMRGIRIEKVTINIGSGEAGPKLEKSKKIMEKITGKKVVITKTHKRTTFGTPKKKPIGVKVTVRGKESRDLLIKLFQAVDNKIKISSFDINGNFSFGIDEYINIPGISYDQDIGILGMDVCVTLERPGFRVKKRRLSRKIGKKHKIKPEESMEFIKKEFGIKIIKEEEKEYY